jgi:hypothetical protein
MEFVLFALGWLCDDMAKRRWMALVRHFGDHQRNQQD